MAALVIARFYTEKATEEKVEHTANILAVTSNIGKGDSDLNLLYFKGKAR